MAKEMIKAPAFNDIVFEDRNKEYGAYKLRKKYNRTVLFAIIIGAVILATAVIIPYLQASANVNRNVRVEKAVELEMKDLEAPKDINVPEDIPPPVETVVANRYEAPEVVDSIKPEDDVKLMTADEAEQTVVNEDVNLAPVAVVQEEVKEYEAPAEIYVVVEENASFPGGNDAMYQYLNDNIKYPDIARENNIQGRVTLKFCVTYKGAIEQIQIMKGIDESLNAEAVRVVASFPAWKPAKQGGRAVNCWFFLPVNFKLTQ
jgi:protein TonB